MSLLPPGFAHPFDVATADAYLAGSLPDVLQEVRNHVAGVHHDIGRIGAFLLSDDGASLTYWADCDGRVLPCPAPFSELPLNPSLSRCGATGRAQTTFVRPDPALAWAGDGNLCPLLILPIRHQRGFFGFLVFESSRSLAAPARLIRELTAWGPLAAGLVARGIESIRTLIDTTRFAHDLTLMRDEETGMHQLRLRDYVRIIADELTQAHGLPEGFADELALFGPLHDIGKVGIPDEILLKPGRLERFEWEKMKEHVVKGRELVDRLIEGFALQDTPGIRTLHDVVSWHHEYLDGSGYPDGRMADEIPLSTRVVSTADIFDALTGARPYKPSWTPSQAFDEIKSLAGTKLDAECVAAMLSARSRIEAAWQGHQA
ncbi:HD domain-containing protein [Azoarcus sp. TTM-91]|uniref:HD-GYP domain-containing protein n=1 Tax=Azoarcus sp. TTM-91 TaxID=2691581 RepID=UPI00145CC566|nr:HD domain-containing phosphohydrolase [Azoarcus sp. TTM-91]NMG35010.1 HD domain-containing protein [Azoarcus sp. TTM-91]